MMNKAFKRCIHCTFSYPNTQYLKIRSRRDARNQMSNEMNRCTLDFYQSIVL